MLNEKQRDLWAAYLEVEGRCLRVDKVRSLATFLDSLAESPDADWFPWARSIAERVVDKGESFVIRMPLFERAVLPALLAGYRSNLLGCSRWLAGLSDLLHRSKIYRAQSLSDDYNEVALLRAAIRQDPTDRWSRDRLLHRLAIWLRFAIHEVPAGVLYDWNGATAEQCLELEDELKEFCTFAAAEGCEERYRDLIERCRFHFRAYRSYLLARTEGQSYSEYLIKYEALP